MVLVLQVNTPEVQLNAEEYAPGELVTGKVYFTVRKPTLVYEAYVYIEGTLTASLPDEASSNGVHLASINSGFSDDEGSDKEGNANHSSHHSRNGSQTRDHSSEDLFDLQPISSSSSSQETRLSGGIKRVKFLKTKPFYFLKSGRTYKPGVAVFDFAIEMSETQHGKPILPSLKSGSNTVNVTYTVKAVFSTPLPVSLLSMITAHPTSSKQFSVVQGPPSEDLVSLSRVTKTTQKEVGHWTKDSRDFKPLLKWAIGMDTTAWKVKVSAAVEAPAYINVYGAPYYLAEGIKLILKSERAPSPVYVSSLRVTLTTNILVLQRKVLQSEQVLMPKTFWEVEIGGETDITFLLSDVKLQEDTIPTIHHKNLSVSHELCFKVDLKTRPSDGTNQSTVSIPFCLSPTIIRSKSLITRRH